MIPVGAARVAVLLVGLAVGLAAEGVAFGWGRPLLWLPDLMVGMTLIASGVVAGRRHRGAGMLLVAAGFAWFVGTAWPPAVYWHRGPLVHLLATYPGARPTSRTGWAVVAAGYAAALAAPVWRNDLAAIVLALVGLVLAGASYRKATGRRRPDRRVVLEVAAGLATLVVLGALLRTVVPAADVAVALLLAYEAAMILTAVRLLVGLSPTAVGTVADLVVDLGEGRAGVLRDAFADALRDPTVRFGYWDPGRSCFVDAAGTPIEPPVPGGGRVMTTIDRDGRPLAALEHDAAVLTDPSLAEAVAAAARLNADHTDLQSDLRLRIEEVAASVRRVQIAADEERSRLEQRLAAGPEARLQDLLGMLRAMSGGDGHLVRATGQLARTLNELHDIAQGLHPRELDAGLTPALTALADRCPVPVRLTVDPARFAVEVETAVYYVCAEALANIAKHADASSVSIDIGTRSDQLVATVADDGIGGADPVAGTGLAGLADRMAALGGRLTLRSTAGGGTRIIAEIPISAEPR